MHAVLYDAYEMGKILDVLSENIVSRFFFHVLVVVLAVRSAVHVYVCTRLGTAVPQAFLFFRT